MLYQRIRASKSMLSLQGIRPGQSLQLRRYCPHYSEVINHLQLKDLICVATQSNPLLHALIGLDFTIDIESG